VITPEDQALGVLFTPAEMGSTESEIEAAVRGDASYRDEFARLFSDGVTAKNVVRAMAEHLKTLSPASSPIDRFSRGETTALTQEESRGFDVFAGVGRCSRCHVPPTFAGTRPTDFSSAVYSVIGVPVRPKQPAIDPDLGREGVSHRAADAHGFKSPTLRNLTRTAPYFHNGAFSSLDEVIDFYDRGGGRGAGVAVVNQDPDVRPLSLSADDKHALLVFLKTGLLDALPDSPGAPR
jgi:cytochrome c peroxidase